MRLVGVRFKTACRIYTFDAGDVSCGLGDWLVVETERGMALGQVASGPREEEAPPGQLIKKVLRRAEDRDILRYEQNCELEGYAHQFCLERIRELGLPMKLVEVEFLFDGSKALFYFTSEGRVDFRDLVRDLARQFHTRIEMRQIGVRDEAKLVGGVGCCGRELCCATWLTDFAPISVRMAKDQNVSLNPGKISGICGRLMCCLSYEHQMYRELGQEVPKLGKIVKTPRGEGRVVRRNVLEGTFVLAGEGREFEVSVDEYHGRAPPPPVSGEAEPPAGGSRPEGPRRPRLRPLRPAPRPEPPAPPAPEPASAEDAKGKGSAEERMPGSRRRRSRRKRKGSPPAERKSDG
ncbi:MAG: stage 0 sporulation family protein [Deferrisomatales bacterium]|nr:stage 0 sporulation family protein [Deferrisomatales bacterium]